MCVSWYIFLPNVIAVHYVKDQSSVEGSGNSNKRLRPLSQGEKTADHGAPLSTASDAHSKEDDDVEQENSKRKVMLKIHFGGTCSIFMFRWVSSNEVKSSEILYLPCHLL